MADQTLKHDWKKIALFSGDGRDPGRILEHYRLERSLADRLRNAEQADRSHIYAEVYGTLFAHLPDHPQKLRKDDAKLIAQQVDLLKRIVPKGSRFAEIGAGDGVVSAALCTHCQSCTAIDVSDSVLATDAKPDNFRFVLIDGLKLPFPDESFDFVYSNQLMEHLHPDDAVTQLLEIHRTLVVGGTYYCITPNVHSGPHDVSMYFDARPTGFHLKEYSYSELAAVFRRAGFTKIENVFVKGQNHLVLPAIVGSLIDRVATMFRGGHRPVLHPRLRNLFGVRMLAIK